ncbi:OLC1v1034091C1 [Oldenlandia corymbosa var. corymbosa]|uniref:OLC1v1034091C1 n=1 Tax=Oldenlandia corymbosa var. corymbosa TaxID=529605 RepID=A0AAV1CRE1_OLDCO|nr:OLC1v1034091C1 [Oldenlandia corymbosa var. corymbosa]
MWRFLGRSPDRFSVPHFRFLANELRRINYVDFQNREVVVDLMQSIVEIATYGDKHDPAIFECFMESQILPEFVRILKIRGSSSIEAPLLQYMSIMIQNIENEHAICYFLSNGYINSIIVHEFDFEGGDIVPYYVSFLRAVGGKLDGATVCLLVDVDKGTVVSFPLYEAALNFVHYEEKMIQIAVRALILKIYKVADEMIFRFITSPPVANYFAGLIKNIENKCFRVEALTTGLEDNCSDKKREVLLETDRILDDFYYLKDMISIPDHCLNKLIVENLVNLLVLPMLLSLLNARQSTDRTLSPITCLCMLCRLLQVLEGTNLVNVIGSAILCFCMPRHISADLQLKGAEIVRNNFLRHSSVYIDLRADEWLSCLPLENSENECRILGDNHSTMVATLLLLFIVADSKDLDPQLREVMGFSEVKTPAECNRSIFARQARKIVNQLLKVLASNPPGSVAMLFQTAWFLRKLLVFLDQKLDDHDYLLFKTSWELSCERLCGELNRCWFDCIPDRLKNEWDICTAVLEESSHSKDPFCFLELASAEVTPRGLTCQLYPLMFLFLACFLL